MNEPARPEVESGGTTRPATGTPADPSAAQEPKAAPTILDQMGGISGLISSTVPVVAFVLVNVLTSLTPAIIAALAVAVGIAVWRLVRREALQPAVSGLFGVGICAFIAYRTGEAKDFFLPGIWYSAALALVFLVSVLVRWPLAGVIWEGINGQGRGWRKSPRLLRAYTIASLLWFAVFASKFVVQNWLYDSNETGWLGVARLAMGYPLAAVALLGTIWAVRRASTTRTGATG